MKKLFKADFNAKEVVKLLNDIQKKMSDLTPFMKLSRKMLKQDVDENFETEGTASGDKWQEWSEEWKKRRIKKGRGAGKILGLDGFLRRSIKAKNTKTEAIVGTNTEYAAIHNFGFKGKVSKKTKNGLKRYKINMPKREFMRLSDYEKEDLQAELYILAKRIFAEAGGRG